jgi:hypothetical protein
LPFQAWGGRGNHGERAPTTSSFAFKLKHGKTLNDIDYIDSADLYQAHKGLEKPRQFLSSHCLGHVGLPLCGLTVTPLSEWLGCP